MVLKGNHSSNDILEWLNGFQDRVNDLAGNDFLQFTAVIWSDEPTDTNSPCKRVTIERNNHFPFLDMELSWTEAEKLSFGVHLKPNQQLKYLNEGSAHTQACFKAITTGVYKRLASLTTVTNENKNSTLEQLYPKHFEALKKANLITSKVPTLEEELSKIEKPSDALKNTRDKDRKRSIYFWVAYSDFWQVPILRVILKLRKKHKLKCLRVSMSYHRFTNMREIFQGDLSSKLNDGLSSLDFECLKCNCNTNRGKKDGFCKYNNCCREQVVVYQAECQITGKRYIGNTQNHLKIRMQQHTTDVQR